MDELEKLYDELPYFDKQRFLKKHLDDAKPEDLSTFLYEYEYPEMSEIIAMLGYDEYTYLM